MPVISQTYCDPKSFAWGLAEVYATPGEKQKAIDCLEIAYKNRGDFVPWMKADLYFKPLLN
ncbi:MAG: hypothetical protein GYA41_11475 [Bacteroidales bacterium]|nr:hypothetical protein [Bacteroidales bacterium]